MTIQKMLLTLQKRIDWLVNRTTGRPDLSYDRAELSALMWAMVELAKAGHVLADNPWTLKFVLEHEKRELARKERQ